jgi:DNA-binding response OmpR family regulator
MEQRILIVDDNTDLASIMSMILAAEGFSVKVCDNLTSSAICIEEWSPQLIVLDVNLNGEDGRELCNRLKSDKSSNNIKVILMSGDETTLNTQNCLVPTEPSASHSTVPICWRKYKNVYSLR